MMWMNVYGPPARWKRCYIAVLLLVTLGMTACGVGLDTASQANTTVQSCNGCASGVALVVSWAPNPSTDAILGYQVYAGPDPNSPTQLVSDLAISGGVLNPNAPMVIYNAGLDLGLKVGDPICFRLIAYNNVGPSGFSGAACTTI